jgi:hypothetical protein
MRLIFCSFLLAVVLHEGLFAQPLPKQLPAKRTSSNIKIDGNIDEPAWKDVIPAKDFVEFRPNGGAPEDSANRTEIFLLYDNTAVYVAGFCHERTRDSISTELVGRDVVGVNDFVGVIFDTYYDKINAVGFYITPLGEQYDAKYSPGDRSEDETWSAVWSGEAKIRSDGWTFEMRIPYSALRFSSRDNQTWGLNITRRRNKTGQQYMWNPIDVKVNGLVNQEGAWTGIEKIKPTLRLSFSPYMSVYANHYPYDIPGQKNLTSSVNGGMDVKYGISQSFTLDMTLIPDFGQVQSDNQVLNLTPFEIKYNEYRSFFTEGTELFSKGNLFYSRRVGGLPLHYYDVQDTSSSYDHISSNERFIKNPTESKLLNATKISGRTKSGFGLGFFNAVTQPMYATVEDITTLSKRKIETNPLTNYNILVFDQTLKNHSSISFINTSVLRNGSDYDANVSAALFDVSNKKNTYKWNGKFAVSQLFNKNDKYVSGYAHLIGFAKSSGSLNFMFNEDLANDKYDVNDAGILFNNNYLDHYLWVGYQWVKPTKWYNQARINYNGTYSRHYRPAAFQNFFTNVNGNLQLKNLAFIGIFFGYIAGGNDFYEPRKEGRIFKSSRRTQINLFLESNVVKKYSYGFNLQANQSHLFKGRDYQIGLFNNFRFNDKFSIGQQINYEPFTNDAGFYDFDNNDVIFSRRDRHTVENVFKAKYNFNNKSGITFRARHYWSKVKNKEFFILNTDGSLSPDPSYANINHQNFNSFNIDMVYTLQFAPGSFINLVWKNAIYTNDADIQYKYFKNLDRTIGSPQNNSISLKILYYLDYVNFKKKK